jgi:hypothetical protein
VQVLSYNIVNGTTLKYNCRDYSQKFKFANTSFNYEIGYKPVDHNTDEKSLQLKHSSKFEPATGKLESTETLKFGSPQLGPLRFWETVSAYFRIFSLSPQSSDIL